MTDRDEGGRQELRFAADAMLGRLARYLRFLGHDVSYRPHAEDDDLVREAGAEGRVLLTRDRAIVRERKVDRALLVESETVLEQLREVVTALELDWRAPRSRRCTLCNAILEPAPRETVVGRVAPRVLSAHDRFERCPRCDRIYWEGSHALRMRERIAGVLER
jgi:uncharacterized protein with PIN domain